MRYIDPYSADINFRHDDMTSIPTHTIRIKMAVHPVHTTGIQLKQKELNGTFMMILC